MNNENIEAGVCGRVTGNYESHWSGLRHYSILYYVYFAVEKKFMECIFTENLQNVFHISYCECQKNCKIIM